MSIPSAFYAFGSGALEQGLNMQEAKVKKAHELAKMILPYALDKTDKLNQKIERGDKVVENLTNNGFTQNEIGLASQLTNNTLIEADDPLASMKNIIDAYYGGSREKFEANAKAIEQTKTGVSDLKQKQVVIKENLSKLGIAPEGVFDFYYNYDADQQQQPVEGAETMTAETQVESPQQTVVAPSITLGTRTFDLADQMAKGSPDYALSKFAYDELTDDSFRKQTTLLEFMKRGKDKEALDAFQKEQPESYDFMISLLGDGAVAGTTKNANNELVLKGQLESALDTVRFIDDPVAKTNALNDIVRQADTLFPNGAQEVLNEIANTAGAQSFKDLYPA